MGAGGKVQEGAVGAGIDGPGKHARGHPVGSVSKDLTAIDLEGDGERGLGHGVLPFAFPRAGPHDEADPADADALVQDLRPRSVGCEERDPARVQRLVALAVRPPKERMFQAGGLSAVAAPGEDDLAGGVQQFPEDRVRDGARGLDVELQVRRREVIAQRVAQFGRSQAGLRADLEAGLVPNSQGNEPWVEVPSVAHLGLCGLRRLRLRGGMDDHLEHVARFRQALKIDLEGRKHALVLEKGLAVEADGAGIVDPPAYEIEPFGMVRQPFRDTRAVVPEAAFHPAIGLEVVALVHIGPTLGPRPVHLDRSGHRRGDETRRHGVKAVAEPQGPGQGRPGKGGRCGKVLPRRRRQRRRQQAQGEGKSGWRHGVLEEAGQPEIRRAGSSEPTRAIFASFSG